uniref:Uncharacterized protein n=1 Tax=Hemiselmis andersenii TaxID=464988 RepID=A0A6U2D1B0_HEMAN
MHEFKAKLKQSVAMMIREQFKQPGNLGGQSPEAAKMISDLNAVLKDEINALLYAEFPAKKLGSDQDTDALQLMLDKEKQLAEEAEINLDFGKATVHLNRRVVAVPKDAQLWYDLGSVVVRSGDIAKAQECFRQAVTVDPTHVASLLAFGILMTVRDKFSEADKFFKEAVSASPAHVLAWSCAVLFYDLESRDLERRTALKQMDTAQKKEKNPAGKVTKRSPYVRSSQFCLEMGSTQMVERAMTQELHRIGDSEELQVTLGRAYLMNRQFEKCRQHLQAALQLEKKSTVSMTLMGHSHYMEQRWPDHRADMPLPPFKEAMAFYDKALNTKPPNTEVLQYIRLARIQIAIKKIAEAADTLKKCINMQPSATAWLGRAIALTMQEDYDRAEEALQEAVILDDHNAEVWGMTAIVALHQSTADGGLYQPKADEAVRAINRALKGGLGTKETFPTSEFILQQAGVMFLKIGHYDDAAAAFRRALSSAQGSEAIFNLNKSLAECCTALNDIPSMIEAHRKCGELATTKADWEAAVRALIKATEQQSKAQSKKYSELLKKDVWTQGAALP